MGQSERAVPPPPCNLVLELKPRGRESKAGGGVAKTGSPRPSRKCLIGLFPYQGERLIVLLGEQPLNWLAGKTHHVDSNNVVMPTNGCGFTQMHGCGKSLFP